MENPDLAAWLCRFDNYRRLLTCRKPGRKPKTNGTLPLTAAQVLQLHTIAQQQGANVLTMNSNLNTNENGDSVYRRDHTNQALSSIGVSINSTSSELSGETIGNIVSEPETGSLGNEKGTETNETFPLSKPNSSPLTPEGQRGGAAAKDVKQKTRLQKEQKAAAMAGIPADHWAKLTGQTPQKPASMPKRIRRQAPEHLEESTRVIATELHDNPAFVRSDVTRMAKIYFASEQIFANFSVEWFYQQVSTARDQARGKANIEYVTDGDPNRVPYFFTCFETLLGFSGEELAYIRSEEPLYADGYIGDFVQRYRQQQKK